MKDAKEILAKLAGDKQLPLWANQLAQGALEDLVPDPSGYPGTPTLKEIVVTFHRTDGSLGDWAGPEQPNHIVARVKNLGKNTTSTIGAGYTFSQALVNLARQMEASELLEE